MMKGRDCELCDGEAALYCPSDSAFLCWNCDAKVHEANFLVARHVRCPLCSKCTGLITDIRISGVGFRPTRRICRFCSHESPAATADGLVSLSTSSSSACISNAESCSKHPVSSSGEVTSKRTKAKTKTKTRTETVRSRPPPSIDSKAESILENWCRKLGLNGKICGVALPVAVKAFGVCSSEENLRVLPSRVSLTASLWLSLRLCGDKSASTWQVLKLLEQISGVPAKLIVAAESKLARVLSSSRRRRSRSHQLPEEEGWAET